jgi:hypothetical protein
MNPFIACQNKESNLQIRNCSFLESGALVFEGEKNLSIEGCYFDDCSEGCIVLSNRCRAEIRNSSFLRSHSISTSGSAINVGQLSSLYLLESSFDFCYSESSAGIIFLDSYSNLTLSNSTFLNSIAALRGGAIFMSDYSKLSAFSSVFRNCSAMIGGALYAYGKVNLLFQNCSFHENNAAKEGGALYLFSSSRVVLDRVHFRRNVGYRGGSIFAIHVIQFLLLDCTFWNNHADFYGGALFIEDFSLINCTFSTFLNNIASSGGAIHTNKGHLINLSDSLFSNNSALIDFSRECEISNAGGAGGAISIFEFPNIFDVRNNWFNDNRADVFGGAIGILSNANLTIKIIGTYGIFLRNQARSGNNFGAPVLKVIAETDSSHLDIMQGEQFVIYLRLIDGFNQSFNIGGCSVEAFSLFISDDLNPIYAQLLKLDPFEFSALKWLEDAFGYELKFRFLYQQVIALFPSVDTILRYSISIRFRQYERYLWSNSLNATVRLCSSGYALEADAVSIYKCVPCLAGAFANISDGEITICSKCPSGKYSFALSSYCMDCDRGYFSAGQGESCLPCSSGTFAGSIGSTTCQKCEIGRYSEKTASSICFECPMESTTLQNGSYVLSKCVCSSGSYGIIPSIEGCRKCKMYRGVKCDANSSVPFADQGYWRNQDDVSLVYECIPRQACLQSGFLENTICEEGYIGKRCGACSANRFRSNYDCALCPGGWITWTIFFAVLILILCVYFYILNSRNSIQSSRYSFRIILVSIQTLGVLSRFTDSSNNNAILSSLLSLIDLSNLNFELVFALECFSKNSKFWGNFTIKTLSLPILFIFTYLVGIFISRLYLTRRRKESRLLASALDKSIALFFVVLTNMYTFILSNVLSAFRCFPQDDGTFTLLSSPALDCYDSYWNDHIPILSFGILMIILIPVALFIKLYLNRSNRMSNKFYWRFSRFFEPYKPKFYYWEVVVMIRRTIFVALVDLTNSWQKLERAFVLITFLIFESFVDIICQPYADDHALIFELRTLYVQSNFPYFIY